MNTTDNMLLTRAFDVQCFLITRILILFINATSDTMRVGSLKLILITLFAALFSLGSNAQQKVVENVKKDINGLSLTAKNYQSALDKLKPAFTDDETKNKVETWLLAGKICFGYYDKSMIEKSIGSNIDKKAVGKMLITGYDYFQKALKLDSTKLTKKDGTPIVDKNGNVKYRTKYSRDIMKRILSHLVDFSAVGGDLLIANDCDGAYLAWDIYCKEAKSDFAIRSRKAEVDTIVGYYRYYQGLAATQNKKYENAAKQFENAIKLKYQHKDVYDNLISALLLLNDSVNVVEYAKEANALYGERDAKYARILINSYLNTKSYKEAADLLDKAIGRDSTNAEYVDLKGQLVERMYGVDQALPYYKQAVKLNPEFARAQFNLGNSIYKQAISAGDKDTRLSIKLYKESLPYLEKAYQLNPDDSDVKKILSRIYYVIGSKKLDEIEKK